MRFRLTLGNCGEGSKMQVLCSEFSQAEQYLILQVHGVFVPPVLGYDYGALLFFVSCPTTITE